MKKVLFVAALFVAICASAGSGMGNGIAEGDKGNGFNRSGNGLQDFTSIEFVFGIETHGLMGKEGVGLLGTKGNGLIGREGNGFAHRGGNGIIGKETGNGVNGKEGVGIIAFGSGSHAK